ncbi:MAG TPA: hypothetical protein VF317_03580, partial [Dermatophilaceae bacterium]
MLIDYELAEHELALLLAACECVDNLDRLADEAAGGAVTVTNARADQVASSSGSSLQSVISSRLRQPGTGRSTPA